MYDLTRSSLLPQLLELCLTSDQIHWAAPPEVARKILRMSMTPPLTRRLQPHLAYTTLIRRVFMCPMASPAVRAILGKWT